MAIRRALRRVSPRALAVAVGVPALFALLATGLATGGQLSSAQAAPVIHVQPVVAAVVPARDYSVRRTAVIDFARLVHREFTIDTNDRVAFITVDDGVFKDPRALAFVRSHKLPITAFISTWTVKDRAPYFSAITEWGSIQNHSATHASFAQKSTDLDHEICYSQRMLKRTFGEKPWMLRPPYGAGSANGEVLRTAFACGLREVVLWDAYAQRGKVVRTARLGPGSVILLHFNKNLVRDLRAVVSALHKAGLRPADLADYLPDRR